MKKILLTLSATLFAMTAMAQHSYMSAPGVAVFYPENYDASAHSPSPIFERELYPVGEVPADWRIRPVYSQNGTEQVVTLHVGDDVDLYGGGEVWGSLRRNGKTIEFWNMDNPYYNVDDGTHLYQSHPWIMGLRPDGSAFGIIADNTWRGKMTADKDVVFTGMGPAFRVVVIERESPQALMKTLSDLTGNMELPPMWALGYQQCRFSYHPDTRVKEIADTLRYHKIPSDVIWMDIHYMDKFKIFTFDPVEFPDPKALNDYLHERNFKTVYMIDPGVKVEKGYWLDDEGTAKDYWVRKADGEHYIGKVWPGPCHFPDFTRPEVRRWWSTLYVPFMAQGIGGVWNDMNEPAIGDGPEVSMPKDNIHRGGEGMAEGPHLRYHNVYGFNMVRASRDGLLLANPDKRPFVLSRSNFLGGHRYAATWTGDNYSSWEQFKASVPMSLTLGLSGQPFNGPDIGGFVSSTNADLLAHWTALGVYFPFVRNHTTENSVAQEPWAFDKKTLDICRTAINRRYRLMPYIYTLFEEASVNGMPVMRPAFMLDPKNKDFRTEEQAFMLGGDLYVIPRWASDVALPEGNWNILELEDEDDGVQPYLAQRPGSVIPMANLYQSTAEMSTDSLTLLVNPDPEGKATGTLYEDAGDGFGYLDGEYARYDLKAETAGKVITVSIRKVEGKMESKPRTIRIGYVTDNKVTYSPWISGDSASMKIVKDKTVSLPLTKQTRVDKIRQKFLCRDESSVIVVAHRGDWRNFPENSLEGIESAIQMGVDMVELDVQRTKDGVLILMHDHDLDRTTTGHGNVADVTWEYISGLNLKNGCSIATGQKVPTLEQALLLCKDRVMINLDKADRYFDEIYRLLEKTGTTDLILMKGGQPAEKVKEQFGSYLDKVIYMPVVGIDDNASENVVKDHMDVLNPVAFEMCFSKDSSPMVGKMKRMLKGRSLIWINSLWASLCGGHHDDVSVDDMDKGYAYLIDELGARIIQTDRPEFLIEYLRSRNLHK